MFVRYQRLSWRKGRVSREKYAQVQTGEGFYDVVHKALKCIAEVADASRGDGHPSFITLF